MGRTTTSGEEGLQAAATWESSAKWREEVVVTASDLTLLGRRERIRLERMFNVWAAGRESEGESE